MQSFTHMLPDTTLVGLDDGQVVPLVTPACARRARFGEYEVVVPLASGGMGGVYLAKHAITGERVALKVLDPVFANHDEVVSRLYGELDVAVSARHPGLVEIRGAARSADDVPYLVMEYLPGDTLAQLLEHGPIDMSTVTAIGAQTAAALAALHAAGVIHCDVKPDNVVVVEDRPWGGWPRVKVIDFGVSRRIDEPPPEEAAIAGTPVYMAPEQWRGQPQPASDVYSLGCMLYELVTGELLFSGSLPQLLLAHLEQRPPRPSWLRAGVPPELERLIMRALSKDPAMRPTMLELADQLGDLAVEQSAGDTLQMAAAC